MPLTRAQEAQQVAPKRVEALQQHVAVAVAAGENHSMALTEGGAVWSWGCGEDGRLGHGDEQYQLLPTKIEAFAGQRVIAVSAGAHDSFAITADESSRGAGWPLHSSTSILTASIAR